MFCSGGEAHDFAPDGEAHSKTEEHSGLTEVFFNIANSRSGIIGNLTQLRWTDGGRGREGCGVF